MTGRQEYDRTKDRHRTVDEYMVKYTLKSLRSFSAAKRKERVNGEISVYFLAFFFSSHVRRKSSALHTICLLLALCIRFFYIRKKLRRSASRSASIFHASSLDEATGVPSKSLRLISFQVNNDFFISQYNYQEAFFSGRGTEGLLPLHYILSQLQIFPSDI